MSRKEDWFPSHLMEMSRTECLDLLESHQVGRVAYCDDLGPVVLPVNYAMDEETEPPGRAGVIRARRFRRVQPVGLERAGSRGVGSCRARRSSRHG